jgi:hypothetical protein
MTVAGRVCQPKFINFWCAVDSNVFSQDLVAASGPVLQPVIFDLKACS